MATTIDLANINSRTEVLACSQTSASKTFSSGFAGNTNVSIYNKGPNDVFVTSSVGTSAATFPTSAAGQSGSVVPPNSIAVFDKGIAEDTINAICATGETATIIIQMTAGA